jgi:hypothetical protein
MAINSYYRALRPITDRHKSPRKAARDTIAPELARLEVEPALPAAPSKLQQLEAMVKAGRVGDPLAGLPEESAGFRVRASGAPRNDRGESLLDRVQHIYENSVVPVREIARLIGVSERTLYKYVRRHGWARRHVCLEAGPLPNPPPASGRSRPSSTGYAGEGKIRAASRGQRLTPRLGFERAKGAGGRFIAFEERGTPQPHGPKALDPLAAEAAGEICSQAGAMSDIAAAQALVDAAAREADRRAIREAEADVRTLAHLTRAVAELTKLAEQQEAAAAADQADQARRATEEAAEIRRVEDLRRDLARKLEALIAERTADERRQAGNGHG